MSVTILEFAIAFVKGKIPANEFTHSYMELWKIERDKNILQQDDDINECLSSNCCLADFYNPGITREDYELDAIQLKTEVGKLINKMAK